MIGIFLGMGFVKKGSDIFNDQQKREDEMMSKSKMEKFKIPKCCEDCRFLEYDCFREKCPPFYYCLKNIWWPVRKQTCKKREE